ncbi:helix-turn-helix domain-containing protein [Vibrio superstes]|uniref:HTH araC/xylS-type domain-containing protein n=1 Tax=Vibrio superstes NBRC 103154 TaxID=1219062 RepID=A0A511QRC5_9VIBR|nr:AraC family transcriptional regulator [Vibrio superstes]GEM79905.1 hypothetical protein VSU01S_21500 [Vibrio superstes NBRC 103154]
MSSTAYHVPVTRSSYINVFVSAFTDAGLNKVKLLNENRLPADIVSDEQELIPTLSLRRLIYSAAKELGDKVTLEIIQSVFRNKAIPSVLHLFSEYSTIREALSNAESIFTLDSPGSSVYLHSEYGKSWFCRSPYNEPVDSIQWHEPFVIAYVMELIFALTQKQWVPSELKLQVVNCDLVDLLVGKQCQLYINQAHTAIYISEDILDQAISFSDNNATKPEIFAKWHTTFSDTVFDLVESYSREQNLSITEAADILGLSERTLQRKLKAESTTYRNIKDSVLYSLSCQMMQQGQNLTYIAEQLGFQNISHFSRAFRRITGVTATEYMRVLSDK